jgi:Lysophospholipase
MAYERASGIRQHLVRSGDIELAMREHGQAGPPSVVLLHGYPDTGRVWDEVAGQLATRFHVITYDIRGVGASSAPEGVENYRMELLLEDLRAVVDAPAQTLRSIWWAMTGEPSRAGRR